MADSVATREQIEQMLRDKGVEWNFFDEFDVEAVDIPKSLANQARLGQPLNMEHVENLKEGMKRGDQFPALVLYKTGNKFVVIDGNHRVAAASETGYIPAAYVVSKNTPAQVIVMLTYEANTKHGLPTNQNERARHAVYLVENANETLTNAAARMNIPLNFLSRFYSVYRADNRANQLGVPAAQWRELHIGSRRRLNALLDDDVFKSAVDYAFKARLNATEVDELVTRLRTMTSTAEQLKTINADLDNQGERLAAVATGEVRPRRVRLGGPRQSLRSSIYMIESLTGDKRQQLLDGMTPIEAEESLERLRKSRGIMDELIDALGSKAKE